MTVAFNVDAANDANPAAGTGSAPASRAVARPDAGHVVERMLEMMSVIPRAPYWISTAQVHARLDALGYPVDRRTVVRDLNKLSTRFGFSRRGEGGGGSGGSSDGPRAGGKRAQLAYAWQWPANAAGIGAPVLTEAEALTLVMVREHLASLLPPMVTDALAPHFARANTRLKQGASVSGAGLREWDASVRVVSPTQPLAAPAVKLAVRDAICLALAARTQFTGWYRRRRDEQAKEYVFNPLGLLLRGQVTYLVATVWDYSDARLYPLHRFERARKEDTRRHEPPGFDLDAYLAAQNGLGFATGRGAIALVLRFRNEAGAHLRETPLAADQQISERGDGVLEVSATVAETCQLTWWLLGFGDNVEVLAPAHLREGMRATAAALLARYQPGAA